MEAYSIYLMISLAQSNGIMFKELEYDLAWSKGQELLTEFEASDFNVDEKSECDCINEFLEDKNPKTTIQVCSNCESNHVEQLHWVNVNTDEVGGTTGEEEDTWCNKCEGHHKIIDKQI
jgi:hypothetical protein